MNLLHDLRYTLRSLRQAPLFATTIVVTVALGIGANTAIYSMVKATVFRSAPFDDSERLVAVWTHLRGSAFRRSPSSCPDLLDWRDHSDVFEEFGYYFPRRTFNLSGSALEARRILGGRMSASLLSLLRVNPVLGRVFLPEEDFQGARAVAVLTYGFWLQQFGGDEEVIGKTVRLDQLEYEIIGVLPSDFRVTSPSPALWVPFSQEGSLETFGREVTWVNAVGRLKPNVTVEQASAALDVISANNRARFPNTNQQRGVFVEPLRESLSADQSQVLYLMWLAAGFVLLIACVNVANLMLGKLSSREREVAIRAAIGAGRWRLTRQFLTESAVLACLGGLLGVGLAALQTGPLARILSRTVWTDLPTYLQDVSMDSSALMFAGFTSIATGFMFGILPAIVQSQSSVTPSMSGREHPDSGRRFLRTSLVTSQVSLSMTLLVGVGLSVSALLRAQSSDVGFATDSLSVLRIELPRTQFATSAGITEGRQVWRILPSFEASGRALRERLAVIPGVLDVGLSSLAPPNCCRTVRVEPREVSGKTLDSSYSEFQTVSPSYFKAMGIPLVQGRAFTNSDSSGSVIVTEAFVREYFGNEPVLGKAVITHGWRNGLRNVAVIVGVAADSLVSPWQIDGPRPRLYFPVYGQPEETPGNMRDDRLTLSYVIRTKVSPATVFPGVKQVVSDELPEIPIAQLTTMETEFEASLEPARTLARLLGSLSLVAVLLTAMGLYAVVGEAVARRKREFGVRLAIGEVPLRLLVSVLGSVWRIAAYGIVCGGFGAFVVLQVMRHRLYQVDLDLWPVLATMALLLIGVATFAGYLPARTAAKLEPSSVLRDE